ncbi:putative Beta-ketoacyl synthase [Photobacterium gaetbulicola Gung47]|uniref:Putative Beta-ketoacyl synthase n=2 Tax=Photobacterium gaetbulicola TaxID=1295392 RepID=A0A0C5WKQ0_9GAMM|nr:putative Beta-ketoacyl synthase [Photobacterium gaetbulicola Gung47]
MGNCQCFLANRLSYYFGLTGPSSSINAACASSLVAINHARHDLLHGDSEYALVGAVNLNIHPWKYISFGKYRMLSPDGQCKTFDARANGYVPGDGAAVILLQRLDKAIKNKASIHGIIKGLSVNHVGRSASLTAPKVELQKKLIQSAQQAAGVDSNEVSYIEAHGTGTSLGDPIEVEALTQAFKSNSGKGNERSSPCYIGSVKTNVGHLEAAAGMAGLFKVILMMKNNKLVRSLNISEPNPVIKFDKNTFEVVTSNLPWVTKSGRLIAGVSSFGFGGSNAHVIVESFDKNKKESNSKFVDRNCKSQNKNEYPILISAKSKKSLEKLISQWCKYCDSDEFKSATLEDISKNSILGREHYKYRWKCIVDSKDDLKLNLNNIKVENPKLNDESISIIIDDLRWNGYNEVAPIIKDLGGLDAIISFYGENDFSSIEDNFTDGKWKDEECHAFSVLVSSLIIKNTLQYIRKPIAIYGRKNGVWVMANIVGSITIADAVSYLLKTRKVNDLSLSWPNIPLKDVTTDNIFSLESVDAEYLSNLVYEARNSDVDLDSLKTSVSLMEEHQFTFKKYIKEWDYLLDAENAAEYQRLLWDVIKNEEAPCIDSAVSSLVYIIFVSSVADLNKKWNLSKRGVSHSDSINVILNLLGSSRITKQELVAAFCSENFDWKLLANNINKRPLRDMMSSESRFIQEWKNNNGLKPDLNWVIDLSNKQVSLENLVESVADDSIVFSCNKVSGTGNKVVCYLNDELSFSITDWLSELWQQGIDVKWPISDSFNRLRLPKSEFMRKKFWHSSISNREHESVKVVNPTLTSHSRENEEKATPAEETEVLAEPMKVLQSDILSSEDSVISDHVITERLLLPLASYLAITKSLINKLNSSFKPCLKNINVLAASPFRPSEKILVNSSYDNEEIAIEISNRVVFKASVDGLSPQIDPQPRFPFSHGEVSKNEIYQLLSERGYQYGPELQCVTSLFSEPGFKDYKVSTQSDLTVFERAIVLLDGCLQAALLALYQTKPDKVPYGSLLVPCMIKELEYLPEDINELYIRFNESELNIESGCYVTDILITDVNGVPYCNMNQVLFRQVSNNFLDTYIDLPTSMYQTNWALEELDTKIETNSATSKVVISSRSNVIRQFDHSEWSLYASPREFLEFIEPLLSSSHSNSYDIVFDLCSLLYGGRQELTLQEQANLEQGVIRTVFELVKQLKKIRRRSLLNILFVAEDSLSVYENEQVANAYLASLIGFCNSVSAELTKISLTYCDLSSREEYNFQDLVANELVQSKEVSVVAYRDGLRFTRGFNLLVSKYSDLADESTPFRDKSTYLISGGLGGVGFEISKMICQLSKASLVLVGRSLQNEEMTQQISYLRSYGNSVHYYSVDLSDYNQVMALFKDFRRQSMAINGVIHGAGLVRDGLMLNKSWDDFSQVLYPKWNATNYLITLMLEQHDDVELEFFVGFSSVISLVGNRGQIDYATANSYLDSIAQTLYGKINLTRFKKVLSINWTLWEGDGMGDDPLIVEHFKSKGLPPISPEQGVNALWDILASSNDLGSICVLKENYDKWLQPIRELPVTTSSELTSQFNFKPNDNIVFNGMNTMSLQQGTTQDKALISAWLTKIVALKIGCNEDEIDIQDSFFDLGVESLALQDIYAELEVKYGNLPATLLFDFTTIEKLAGHLNTLPVTANQEVALATNLSTPVAKDPFADTKEMNELKESYQSKEDLNLWLTGIVASQIDCEVDEVDSHDSFFDLGVESLALQNIAAELSKSYDNLPATLLFDFPNIDKLSAYLVTQKVSTERIVNIQQSTVPAAIAVDDKQQDYPLISNSKDASHEQIPIAIIGIAGRFPEAETVTQFWENIKAHKQSVVKVPLERWDADSFENSSGINSYGKWGGFLTDVDKFDPLFFSVTPKEAEQMDPQQRLFLQTTWHAMENAGYGVPESYKGKTVGLFVGTMWNDYSLVTHDIGYSQGQYQGPGSIYWAIANRVSYIMDFHGPSMAVDTACSSSLVAIDLACQSIIRGDCEMAVAGGVNLIVHPSKYAYLSEARFLAKDGLCRSFGEGGSGYVPGEGVGSLILKPLDLAEEDGDYIYAVIRGSAVNHGGKAAGFTVPNSDAHSELITKAFRRANILPDQLGYVECHGTGTSLGDPIEVNGLVSAFTKMSPDLALGSIPIGSVKSNIGHLEASAGVAATIKVLGSMQSKELPKSLHSETVNKNINFEQTPLYVLQENESWLVDGNRQYASISSFGAGGTNAHVILEAYSNKHPKSSSLPDDGEWPFLLSARSESQLAESVEALIEWLSQPFAKNFSLKNIACSLAFGRKHHGFRAGCVASSLPELIDNLQQLKREQRFVKMERSAAKQAVLHCGGNSHLVTEWERGREIDWSRYFTGGAPIAGSTGKVKYSKVPLPGYPFVKESYWVGGFGHNIASPGTHLIDCQAREENVEGNETNANRYHHHLSGDDITVSGHLFNGVNIVPGATLMACVIESYQQYQKNTTVSQGALISIGDIVWHRALPLDKGQHTDIEIEFSVSNEGLEFQLSQLERGGIRPEILVMSGWILQGEGKELALPSEYERLDEWQEDSWLGQNAFYAHIHQQVDCKGLRYESAFRRVSEFKRLTHSGRGAGNFASASIRELSAQEEALSRSYIADPLVFDGCLQAVLGLVPPSEVQNVIPVSIGKVELIAPFKGHCQVVVVGKKQVGHATLLFDMAIYDNKRRLVARIRDFTLQITGMSDNQPHFFTPEWSASPLSRSGDLPTEKNMVLLVGWPQILSSKLIHALTSAESSVKVTAVPIFNNESSQALLDQARAQGVKRISVWRYQKQDQPYPSAGSGTNYSVREFASESVDLFKTIAIFDDDFSFDYLAVVHQEEDSLPCHVADYGLMRSLAKELNNSRLRLLELPQGNHNSTERLIKTVLLEAKDLTGQRRSTVTRFKYEQEQRLEYHWSVSGNVKPSSSGIPLARDNSCYLITGGTKGLGLLFAQHLALQASNIDLVLCGRRPLDKDQRAQIEKIKQPGVRVHYFSADIGKEEDVANLLTFCQSLRTLLKGVIHSAGVLDDRIMMAQDWSSFKKVMSPKVLGALWLDRYTSEIELDYLVLFSSITAAVGNKGQTNYGYANAFLDSFSHARSKQVRQGRRFGRTVSINWPLWQSDNLLGGMSVSSQIEQRLYDEFGMKSMSSAQGLASLSLMLEKNNEQILVAPGDKDKLLDALNNVWKDSSLSSQDPALLSDYDAMTQSRDLSDVAEQKDWVIEKLNTVLSEVTGMPIDKIDEEETFDNYGLDSVMIIKLTQLIEVDLGELPKTLFFKYKSTEELAGYLLGAKSQELKVWQPQKTEMSHSMQAESSSDLKPEPVVKVSDIGSNDNETPLTDDIAIIGLAGKYPESETLAHFWMNLANGVDCISEIPEDRWLIEGFYQKYQQLAPGKLTSYSKWGGFLKDVDKFDPLLFGMSPREAELIDPQERLFLQSAWHTFEDAGYNRASMKDLEVGVFAGIMWSHYQIYGVTESLKGNPVPTESNFASVSNRVSYVMDLTGPSMTVDTMCSSSAVAIHLACQSLNNGDCEMALAGGVNLSLHPFKYFKLCDSNFLSDDGRCRSFGEGGNGYVPAEAVGSVLLKPLRTAQRDGDHIYAVIKGTAVNHGGKATGYTVPSPTGQARVIKKALSKAGIDPSTISYVETHGTGTALGDPIEIEGLTDAYQWQAGQRQPCAIGSIKSNIGHPEAAAGIAALTKVILQMKHKTLVPSLHSERLNPNINFNSGQFSVQQTLQEWQTTENSNSDVLSVRRAGINSFGAGGANAHLIIEEYEERAMLSQASDKQLMTISAKNQSALDSLLKLLLDALQEKRQHPRYSVKNIAASLMLGREPLEQRVAFIAAHTEEAIEKLRLLVAGETPDLCWYGNTYDARRDKVQAEQVNSYLAGRDLAQLGALWVAGSRVDWTRLFSGSGFKRVSLPGYPFAKRRCWLSQISGSEVTQPVLPAVGQKSVQEGVANPPLLTSIESKEQTVRYGVNQLKLLALVQDHRINGAVMVPGMVMLEMVLAAAYREVAPKEASGSFPSLFTVNDIVWLTPLTLSVPSEGVENIDPSRMLLELAQCEGGYDFKVVSELVSGGCTEHAIGHLALNEAIEPAQQVEDVDLIDVPSVISGSTWLTRNDVYSLMAEMGMDYGCKYQSITKAIVEDNVCLAILDAEDFGEACYWQPLLLDGMLQSCLLIVKEMVPEFDQAIIPFTISQVNQKLDLSTAKQVLAVMTSDSGLRQEANNSQLIFDLYLLDEEGHVILEISDFIASVIEGSGTPRERHRNSEKQFGRVDVLQNSSKEEPETCLLFCQEEYESGHLSSTPLALDTFGGRYINKTILVIDGNEQLTASLAEDGKLTQSNLLCAKPVSNLTQFQKGDEKGGWINGSQCYFEASEKGYQWLISQFNLRGTIPDHVIFNISKDRTPKTDNSIIFENRPVLAIAQFAKAWSSVVRDQVIHGIVVVQQHAKQPNIANMGLAGLARTLNVEIENFKLQILTLEAESLVLPIASQELALTLRNELGHHEKDADVIYRAGRRYIRGLVPYEVDGLQRPADSDRPLGRPDGVIMITGGAGGIGYYIAQQWIERFSGQLVFTGRSPLTLTIMQKLEALRQQGGNVDYLSCDVTDEEAVIKCLAQIRHQYGPVSGIIHSAGVTDDKLLVNKDLSAMLPVISVKQQGLINLDRASAADPLRFFISFSSIAACFGNAGQSDYAYGNAFVDDYMRYRNQLCREGVRHGFSQSIAWPLWDGVGGMDVKDHIRQWMLEEWQLQTLSKEQGASYFFQFLAQQIEYAMVFPGPQTSSLLARRTVVGNERGTAINTSARPKNSLLHYDETESNKLMNNHSQQSASGPYKEQLLKLIGTHTADILKLEPNDLNSNVPFDDYGLDSVLSLKLVNTLKASFPGLTTTVLFEQTTLTDFVEHLLLEHGADVEKIFGTAVAGTTEALALDKNEIETAINQSDDSSAAEIKSIVKSTVAEFAKLEVADIRDREPFESFGIDSVLGMQIVRSLRGDFPSLETTALFEYNTCSQLVDYLQSQPRSGSKSPIGEEPSSAEGTKSPSSLAGNAKIKKIIKVKKQPYKSDSTKSAEITEKAIFSTAEKPKVKQADKMNGIAIVGMSGQYANAEDLQAFWLQLERGANAITEFSQHRGGFGELGSVRWGSFLEDYEKFDGPFFKIPMKEAELMDPQERLFLESAWLALEDGGYTPDTMSRYKTGVYVGVMWGQYQLFGSRYDEMLPLRTSLASIANRVSYVCNFKGPSIALDNMCASSLYTAHLACTALKAGEIDCALVGGVNLTLHPHKYRVLEEKNLLSDDGLTRSYGIGGDGYSPGEGVGCLLLKTVEQARVDGDHIYGIIEASVVNHNGHSKSYMTPDPKAITLVAQEALEQAGISGSDVGVIEGHGTGSALGDAIEVNALARAYQPQERPDSDVEIALASLKSNFGHLESASGVAAISKVLLQMQNDAIAPSIHSQELNENIELERTPFYIPQTRQDWRAGNQQKARRFAGINTFGAGGANAHLIIGEYIDVESRGAELKQQHLFVLSAGEMETLSQYATRFVDYLERQIDSGSNLSWLAADISYTLRVGRVVQRERLAIVYTTLDELLNSLRKYISSDTAQRSDSIELGNGLYLGCAEQTTMVNPLLAAGGSTEQYLEMLSVNRELDMLAKIWVSGLLNRLPHFAEDKLCKRLSLPVYPFLKEKCRIPGHKEAINTPQLKPVSSIEEMATKDNQKSQENTEIYLKKVVSDVLGFPASRLKKIERFDELGMDSLNTVSIIKQLKTRYPTLSEIALFEYQSFSQLTKHLVDIQGNDTEIYRKSLQESIRQLPDQVNAACDKRVVGDEVDDEFLMLLDSVG